MSEKQNIIDIDYTSAKTNVNKLKKINEKMNNIFSSESNTINLLTIQDLINTLEIKYFKSINDVLGVDNKDNGIINNNSKLHSSMTKYFT